MPQITVEYTDNLKIDEQNLYPLLKMINEEISATAAAELPSCKSRLRKIKHYLIGDGNHKYAFVHLTLAMLPGRTDIQKSTLGKNILKIMQAEIKAEPNNLMLQFTIELKDLNVHYYKYSSE